jgi:2-dehydropantoate 2-reductase
MLNESLTKMRFLCFGAGAVGSYIGGSLALAGQDVVFLERPEQAEQLRQRGIHLTLNGKEYSIPAPVVVSTIEDSLTKGPFDTVIFAVKSYHTRSVLGYFKPYNVAMPPFLCIQNGVENEVVLAEVIGEDKVIPATLTSAIGKSGVGSVVLERMRGMGVAATHSLAPTLVALLNESGLNARLYQNADSMKWSKLLTNLLANATSAILDMTASEIFAHKALCKLEIKQLREALRVMSAMKIPTVDLPGTPVRMLGFAIQYFPLLFNRPLLQRAVGQGRGSKMPSFHIDLHTGAKHSEVEYLNGAVVRFGEQHDIPTPVNRVLAETLMGLTNRELEIEVFRKNPDALLSRLINLPA